MIKIWGDSVKDKLNNKQRNYELTFDEDNLANGITLSQYSNASGGSGVLNPIAQQIVLTGGGGGGGLQFWDKRVDEYLFSWNYQSTDITRTTFSVDISECPFIPRAAFITVEGCNYFYSESPTFIFETVGGNQIGTTVAFQNEIRTRTPTTTIGCSMRMRAEWSVASNGTALTFTPEFLTQSCNTATSFYESRGADAFVDTIGTYPSSYYTTGYIKIDAIGAIG